MDYQKFRLKLEKQYGEEIFQLINGKIISEILEVAQIDNPESIYQQIMEGQHNKVSKRLTPVLFKACKEVLVKLEFDEKVEFYACSKMDINAVSIPRISKDQNHIIALNSGLVDRLDEDELRFVIGHELGRLICNNALISKILSFIFPDPDVIPLPLRNKIVFWKKLSKLSADRFAFVASPNFNNKVLDDSSHSIDPLRMKAINLFSKSKLFESIKSGSIQDDQELSKSINQLIGNFISLSNSEIDKQRMNFLAAAGVKIAMSDNKIDQYEYENILKVLSNFTLLPNILFKDVVSSDRIDYILKKSTSILLEKSPNEKAGMFQYMINIALVDSKIDKKEIRELFYLGKSLFSYNELEIAQMIVQEIQEGFTPKIY